MHSLNKKKLIVIGDRVLIEPDDKEQRTQVGLYLPQSVTEKEQVHGGWIVSVGPGIPLADPGSSGEEPWQSSQNDPKFLPMQVEEGDYALFLKKSSVEIKWEEKKYLILPQSAILVIMRDSFSVSNDDLDIL
ncbi:MAG: co-chaperone GroES [Calditrichaeota bacterium]|nr:MAG: co-chaperone GroES [Calditrichota bacterium]